VWPHSLQARPSRHVYGAYLQSARTCTSQAEGAEEECPGKFCSRRAHVLCFRAAPRSGLGGAMPPGREGPESEGAPLLHGSGLAHRSHSAPVVTAAGSGRYGSLPPGSATRGSASASFSNTFAWRRVRAQSGGLLSPLGLLPRPTAPASHTGTHARATAQLTAWRTGGRPAFQAVNRPPHF